MGKGYPDRWERYLWGLVREDDNKTMIKMRRSLDFKDSGCCKDWGSYYEKDMSTDEEEGMVQGASTLCLQLHYPL
jgi:hypothetical protein